MRIALWTTLLMAVVSPVTAADWPQWGGPRRDFAVPEVRLDPAWPETGPRLLWDRELGNGHSAIVVEGDTLFTQYGGAKQSRVVALDTATGETRWALPSILSVRFVSIFCSLKLANRENTRTRNGSLRSRRAANETIARLSESRPILMYRSSTPASAAGFESRA